MAYSSSTSRLSALAPPFTISRQSYQQQQQELHASLMFDSLSALNIDDDIEYRADSDSLQSAPSFTGDEGAITGKGKELYQYKILIDKGKELEDYIFVPSSSRSKDEIVHQSAVLDNASNPISTEKYVLPDPHTTFPISTLDVPSTMKGNLAEKSFESFDKYESDIDSPCWKGILASRRSPFTDKVSGSMNSPPPQKELESCKSLNPLAPKFIPSKTEANFTMKSGNSKQESVVVPKGQKLSLRASREVGTQRFGDIPALGNEYVLCGSSSSGSAHQFDHMTKPTPIVVPARGKRNSLTREIVGRSVKSINDSAQNVLPSVSSLSVEHVSNISSSAIAIAIPTEHQRKYQDAANSYSGTLINNMLTLSELLLQNVSNDLDALGEQQLFNLENVMDNLSVCMGKKNEKINLVSDSPRPGTYIYNRRAHVFSKEPWKKTAGSSHWLGDQNEHKKQNSLSAMYSENDHRLAHYFSSTSDAGIRNRNEVQREPWKKTAGSSHWLGDQNEHKKQNSLSAMYSENDHRLAHYFSSTSDAGIRKRNEVQRVVEGPVKEKHENYEELLCQELLYKNLWLDAEAALCAMKRNAYIVRMRAQMDGNMSD